jgi:hypothetical protein
MKNFLFLLLSSVVIGSVLELEEVIRGMETSLPLEGISYWTLYCFCKQSQSDFENKGV